MDVTPPSDALVDALVQSAFVTTAVLQRTAADHDLSLTQLRVLGILQDRTLRMSHLADYLGLDRSTLSGLIDRALARGLVERRPDPADGRSILVILSAAGHELAGHIRRAVADALTPLTHELTATERDRLRQLLERLLDGDPQPEIGSAHPDDDGHTPPARRRKRPDADR